MRKLCSNCKSKATGIGKEYSDVPGLSSKIKTHFEAVGCDKCFYTGYSGRTAIYEIIPIDFELATVIKENLMDIATILQARNINTLQDSAIELVNEGVTSLEEIYPILLNF